MAYLGDKNVGDIVKIKEDGVAVNYLIVHKGKPSSIYDDSCYGVWVLRQDIHSLTTRYGKYEDSDAHTYLNSTFLDLFDSDIKSAINQAIIPCYNGSSVASGANGLSAKIFLLSGYEVGFTTSDNKSIPIDGEKLSYFSSGTETSANNKRIAKLDENATFWMLRSKGVGGNGVWCVNTNGSNAYAASGQHGLRPAFVLPTTLCVDDDGNVTTNNPPTIISDKTGDLGTLDSGFSCNYSVDDVDEGDSVSVTLDLDGAQIDTFEATKNQQETYTLGGEDWLKIPNGEHSFTITASDGKDAATNTITFTRNLTELAVTLAAPFPADDRITACALTVEGSIPADAVCKYEVTNNALDTEPVWEDCTAKSKAGFSYIFTNKTAENGFAFNFRVTISRGASGSGGFITSISGGFE